MCEIGYDEISVINSREKKFNETRIAKGHLYYTVQTQRPLHKYNCTLLGMKSVINCGEMKFNRSRSAKLEKYRLCYTFEPQRLLHQFKGWVFSLSIIIECFCWN